MIPFQPDPPPSGMTQEHAEWIQRQLRRVADFTGQSSEISTGNENRIALLEQHPPRIDNPHQTSWTNLLGKPSCVVNWAGAWNSERTAGYQACDMVRDGSWTMIANKATTERPAPQPQGQAVWVSDIPGTPIWTLQSATTSSLMVGQRYILDESAFLLALRMDWAEITPTVQHTLWVMVDPLGAPSSSKIAGPFVPDATGWVTFPQGAILVRPGLAFDVFMVSNSIDTPSSWSGEWDYKRLNGDPLPREIWHQAAGGGAEMRINHIDRNDDNWSTQLEALHVGDKIAGGGGDWEIISTDHQIDHVRFGVTPAYRVVDGIYIFQFTSYAPQPIAYNRADDHFLSDPAVQGFYSETGYDNIVFDNHAYGVDIEMQEAAVSDDWDLVAQSGD